MDRIDESRLSRMLRLGKCPELDAVTMSRQYYATFIGHQYEDEPLSSLP